MYAKYPSTPFLPWAKPDTDGRIIKSLDSFEGCRVVVTEKMDGENTSMYRDHIHARSIDSSPHVSRNYVKSMWGSVKHMIPHGWRMCGENMYAKHSIYYDSLKSYFLSFSLWNEQNVCLSWEEAQEYFDAWGITTVPVLYHGIYDEEKIRALWTDDMKGKHEGYVVRLAHSYKLSEFPLSIAKFVRKDHVQTSEHWLREVLVPNLLAK